MVTTHNNSLFPVHGSLRTRSSVQVAFKMMMVLLIQVMFNCCENLAREIQDDVDLSQEIEESVLLDLKKIAIWEKLTLLW